MQSEKKYRSFSVSVFNITRILIFGSMALYFSLYFIIGNGEDLGWYTSIVILSILILYFIWSYSIVSIKGKSLKIKSVKKSITINNINNYKTWWCYNFSVASPTFGDSYTGQTTPLANKINCFIKIESNTEAVYLYEEIYLSQKFPNNHPYLHNENIKKKNLIKIWDIDNCLKKLELNNQVI